MAFIHFVLSEGSSASKAYCQIDGFNIISFKNQDFVEVGNGRRVISFESGDGMRWDLQVEAEKNHCIEIQLTLAIGDGLMGPPVIMGQPTYDVFELAEEQIAQIRHTIEERNQIKSLHTKKTVFGILSGVCFAFSILFAVNSFTVPALLIPGAICVGGGIALLIARKKI